MPTKKTSVKSNRKAALRKASTKHSSPTKGFYFGAKTRSLAFILLIATAGVMTLLITRADNGANVNLAKEILANRNVTYWTNNGVNTRDVFVALSQGRAAYTTCSNTSRKTTNVNTNILRFIKEAGQSGPIMVNSLTDKCHSSSSKHYSGEAVDLQKTVGNVNTFINIAGKYGGTKNSESTHHHFDFPCSRGDCDGTVQTTSSGSAPAPSSSSCSHPTIQRSSTGGSGCVRHLQGELNNWGYGLSVDGAWGDKTGNALSAFQRRWGWSGSGVVGRHSWDALHYGCGNHPTIRRSGGTTGGSGCVKHLQDHLRKKGYSNVAIDGAWGSITDNAVRDLQRKQGWSGAGIVGPGTWGVLH